jgi:hypothetical protein
MKKRGSKLLPRFIYINLKERFANLSQAFFFRVTEYVLERSLPSDGTSLA